MADSKLVVYEHLTPKYSRTDKKKIGITPHHAAGIWKNAQQGVEYFYSLAKSNRNASTNYVIANNGEIGQCVLEKNRAWTSSNSANDATHVTIEVSNCKLGNDWPVSDAAYESLVKLSADICKRNGITALAYDGDKTGSVTMHKMFASTACPGPYLEARIVSGKYIQDVNAILKGYIVPTRGYIYDGFDYSDVFDPVYYSSRYPDLIAAGLITEDQLFQHFVLRGMPYEARKACDKFDPMIYRHNNPDLDMAFDDDWEAYYKHYILCGKAELEAGTRTGAAV